MLTGGTESMSQAPYAVRNVRWGTKLGQPIQLEDTLWAGLSGVCLSLCVPSHSYSKHSLPLSLESMRMTCLSPCRCSLRSIEDQTSLSHSLFVRVGVCVYLHRQVGGWMGGRLSLCVCVPVGGYVYVGMDVGVKCERTPTHPHTHTPARFALPME